MLHKLISFIRRKTSQRFKFNQQFEHGVWDGLKDIAELSRYSIIVGYTQFHCKQPHILDLGCGEGILQERLKYIGYSSYLGIDFSDVAVANCKHLENHNTRFEVGDLNKLNVAGTYDVIIYNESIYYLSNPEAAIRALFAQLNDGGIFIFSIVDKHGSVQIRLWERINAILTLFDSTRVTNCQGHSWTIQVYRK